MLQVQRQPAEEERERARSEAPWQPRRTATRAQRHNKGGEECERRSENGEGRRFGEGAGAKARAESRASREGATWLPNLLRGAEP